MQNAVEGLTTNISVAVLYATDIWTQTVVQNV